MFNAASIHPREASQAASPPSIPSELSDVDESMSDVLFAILSRSSTPDSSVDSNGSDSSSDEFEQVASRSASSVSTERSLDDMDADDEQSSCDGCESSVDGSPRLPYHGNLTFEGNIWNEIAEDDDGVAEVNEGFRMLLEKERIRMEVEYRRRIQTRTSEEFKRKCTRLEVQYSGKIETRRTVEESIHDNNTHVPTPHSDADKVTKAPAEELPPSPSEWEGEEIATDDIDIGSPMSLDYFTDIPEPSSRFDNFASYNTNTPYQGLSQFRSYPPPRQTSSLSSDLHVQNPPHARTTPQLPLRYSLPSSRHHPYKRTP
ncbi:hypothetical protein FS749_002816 [Ceratobasidium sp. UAMH 11750]|nr:hypothetical protein FS749_002816 [Ceratobasidium sp. UAMH 11750]